MSDCSPANRERELGLFCYRFERSHSFAQTFTYTLAQVGPPAFDARGLLSRGTIVTGKMGRLVPVTGRESVKLREPPKAFGTNPRFDNKCVGAAGKTR